MLDEQAGPNLFKVRIMESTDGYLSKKSVPKYDCFTTPSFTDWPLGQLRSIIVFLVSESALGLVINGEICSGIGGALKGPIIAPCSSSS